MMRKLNSLTPDVDSAGVFEVVFADHNVLTVALSPGYPMLVQRFPVAGQAGHWLDAASVEFSSLPPLIVGEPFLLDDIRGQLRTAPITWIVQLDDE